MNRETLLSAVDRRALFARVSEFFREAAVLVAVFVPLANYVEKEKAMGLGAVVAWFVVTVVLFCVGIVFDMFAE